jgi:hypothetical protein
LRSSPIARTGVDSRFAAGKSFPDKELTKLFHCSGQGGFTYTGRNFDVRLNSAIAGFETGNLWYSNWAVSLKGGVTANENDGACGNGCARQICGAYLT